jgi:hypothetical protein
MSAGETIAIVISAGVTTIRGNLEIEIETKKGQEKEEVGEIGSGTGIETVTETDMTIVSGSEGAKTRRK